MRRQCGAHARPTVRPHHVRRQRQADLRRLPRPGPERKVTERGDLEGSEEEEEKKKKNTSWGIRILSSAFTKEKTRVNHIWVGRYLMYEAPSHIDESSPRDLPKLHTHTHTHNRAG